MKALNGMDLEHMNRAYHLLCNVLTYNSDRPGFSGRMETIIRKLEFLIDAEEKAVQACKSCRYEATREQFPPCSMCKNQSRRIGKENSI